MSDLERDDTALQAAFPPNASGPSAPAPPRFTLARHGISGEQLLFWLLLELWVLNAADLLLTRYSLWLGFATESNGVMAYFLHEGTLTAAVFKIGIVSVGVLLLWRLRRRPSALVAALALTAVFAAVVAYQAVWVLSL
jgi:hypothetical protein